MKDTYTPDPEFVDRLEWELESVMRRRAPVNGTSSATRLAHSLWGGRTGMRQARWTTGLIALAAMCLGGAATFAVTQRLSAPMADLIIAKMEAQLEFAEARRELIREELLESESRFSAGVLELEHIEVLRLEFAKAEADAATRTLDIEEARITGRAPDNSLSAPILRGRDFVTERLELQRALLVTRISWLDRLRARHKSDSGSSFTMDREQDALRMALSVLESRMALRADYLSGARTAFQIELVEMQSTVESQRESATRRVDEAQQHLDRTHALLEDGLVTQSEARAVEMEFRAAVLQRELAELEMQILQRKLEDSSGE